MECVAGVKCTRCAAVPVLLKAGCCYGREESQLWAHLHPGEAERSVCCPSVTKAEGTSVIGSRRSLHAKEMVWKNWCTVNYKGSELIFKEAALSFLLCSYWWLWCYFWCATEHRAIKKSWWALCQDSSWAPRTLLRGVEQGNIQGSPSSEEPHLCKVLHGLWKTKTLLHAYTVLLIVLIFPPSTGIRAWVMAVYELLPLFTFVIFCLHYQGGLLFSPVEH